MLIAFALLLSCYVRSENKFLHASGKVIKDAGDKEVLLRGMGLGGWMLQEGYMLETSRFAGPQHQIESIIEKTIGTDAMLAFYDAWLANYCTRQDVDSMAAWGFNSIRLPMHYKLFTLPIEDEPIKGEDTWLSKGFIMVDSLLSWCAANEMYLILDLHAAPGGQGKDANISDYDPEKPSLWESAENRRKTIALWAKLAERYKDEPWIGGYDLINEPNWDFDNAGNKNGCNCEKNELLWSFYGETIRAIREVDKNHLLIIEGNCWGNNYKNMPHPATFDNNLVMSFHKYWNYNSLSEIQYILDYREQYKVPVWLGESGENSNTWFTNAIALLEEHQIGWAWWPYKKIASVTGTVTIPRTEGYQRLLDYWNGNGMEPDRAQAADWLMEQAEMMKLNHCIIRYDVLDAMFRQAQGDQSAKAFKMHSIPGTINAVDYDLGANGLAYFDADTANYRTSTGKNTAWNKGRSYRNDGVDIAVSSDKSCYVGWIEDGEWLQYTVTIQNSASYQLNITYASAEKQGKIGLELPESNVSEVVLPSTGGDQKWQNLSIGKATLPEGTHQLKVLVRKGGFNLKGLHFVKQ